MSFSRIGPFSFGQKLTSAQANQWDTNTSNSLDKSPAGDVIKGSITFSGSGKIAATGAATIVSVIAGGIQPLVANGISGNIAGGISSGVADGITTGTPQGISSSAPGGIAAKVANGIASGVDGGIALTGSGGDYLQYTGATRTSAYFVRMLPKALNSGWLLADEAIAGGLVGPGTTQQQSFTLEKMYNGLITGAALSTVTLYMYVGLPHTGIPAAMPTLGVYLAPLFGAPPAVRSLFSGGTVSFPTPASGAAWYNSGLAGGYQTLTLTCNQNNGITTNGGYYYITVVDENGANTHSGNTYVGVMLTFTGISNSAPGF